MPQFPIQQPVLGINRVVPRQGQPPATCWDALNVMPYDRFGRRRVAQRGGLVKQYATALGSTAVQGLLGVNNISYPATLNTTGLAFYNETFASLAEFEQNWSNVPSTWTVLSGPARLHVPANFTPSGASPTFTPTAPTFGSTGGYLNGSISLSFTLSVTGSTAFNAAILSFHLNNSTALAFPTVTMGVSVDRSVGIGLIFTGNMNNSNTGFMGGNASPAAINANTASQTLALVVTGDGTQFGATYTLTVGSGAGSVMSVSGQQNIPAALAPSFTLSTTSGYTADFS